MRDARDKLNHIQFSFLDFTRSMEWSDPFISHFKLPTAISQAIAPIYMGNDVTLVLIDSRLSAEERPGSRMQLHNGVTSRNYSLWSGLT